MQVKATEKNLVTLLFAASLALVPMAGCGSAATDTADTAATEQEQPAQDAEQEAPAEEPEDYVAEAPEDSTEDAVGAATGGYDANGFTFDVPAYWQGRVEVKVTSGSQGEPSAVVTLPGNGNAVLATLTRYDDGESPMVAGDIGSHLVGCVAANGSRVEVWTSNWPWLVGTGSGVDGLSEDEQHELVDLSTGGALSYEDLSSLGEQDFSMVEYDFTSSELVPLVALS